MAIDASIALGVKPPQFESPLNMMAQVLQAKGLQNQNELAQYTLGKAQRTDADMNVLMQHLQGGGNLATPEGQAAAIRIAPLSAPGMIKNQLDLRETQGKIDMNAAHAGQFKSEAAKTAFDTKVKMADQAMKDIAGLPDAPSAMADLDRKLASGQVDQAKYDAVKGTLQPAMQDPAQFHKWQLSMLTNILDAKTRIGLEVPDANARLTAQTSAANNAATNATSTANNRATIAKDYAVAGLNPNGTDPNGTVGGLTPAAIDNAAKRYNFDGTLPPSLGRGGQGPRDIRSILTRASELAGVSPSDASGGRAGQMANKADSAALAQLTRQQQLAASFEKTANANADLALGLSKQLDRTGSPLINAGLQAWRTGTGSPEATQFAAANETFVNEYAKIMSGGMGNGPVTDSARNKAHTLLSTSMTPKQYEGNVKLLQTEMQNRMKGYSDQAGEINSRLRGVTAAAPGASGNAPTASPNVVLTPDGQSHTFPTPELAAKFKKAAGL